MADAAVSKTVALWHVSSTLTSGTIILKINPITKEYGISQDFLLLNFILERKPALSFARH